MSFSVELWDGYDFVYNTFCLHRRGLKDFIYMLTEKHNYELDYAKGMKKIYDMNYAVTNMSSLQRGIMGFKNDLLNHYNYTMEFVNSIREEVIEPLKILMTEQNYTSKILYTEMRKNEKEYKDNVDKLDKSRIKFHNLAKSFEEAKLQSELTKINLQVTNEQKNRTETRAQTLLKDSKEAERIYIHSISQANNSREHYIENTKRILNDYQAMEEKLIDTIKDSLRKYVIYQVALIRNLQYDVEKKANLMESINVQSDIRTFIEKNSTNSLPPYKFEFVPYISEIDSRANFETNKYPKEVLNNVKSFISNVFYTDPPESEPDSIDSKNFNELEAIANFAWEGKKIPDEEKIIFQKFIREKKYRRYFLNFLNKFRQSGLFTLNNQSYFILGDLFSICLNEILIDKDYYSAKHIMNLAQTLYKNATEPNKPRVFLQTLIENHSIWKNLIFWEEFIKYIINEEMHSQKNYNIYTFESQEEKIKRIRSIVVTQLISFSYNMLSFKLTKEKVNDLIMFFSNYYDVEEERVQEIVKHLEEYSFINKSNDKLDEGPIQLNNNIEGENAIKVLKDEKHKTEDASNSSQTNDSI